MKWTVELDPSGDYIRVTTRGTFTAEGHRGMVDDILARPFWQAASHVLFDNRQLNFSEADIDVMRQATEYHAENDEEIGDGRAAIVVSDALSFASARQFKALLERNADARLRVFRELDEAERWLVG